MTRECATCTACCEGWLESARMAMAVGWVIPEATFRLAMLQGGAEEMQ